MDLRKYATTPLLLVRIKIPATNSELNTKHIDFQSLLFRSSVNGRADLADFPRRNFIACIWAISKLVERDAPLCNCSSIIFDVQIVFFSYFLCLIFMCVAFSWLFFYLWTHIILCELIKIKRMRKEMKLYTIFCLVWCVRCCLYFIFNYGITTYATVLMIRMVVQFYVRCGWLSFFFSSFSCCCCFYFDFGVRFNISFWVGRKSASI